MEKLDKYIEKSISTQLLNCLHIFLCVYNVPVESN